MYEITVDRNDEIDRIGSYFYFEILEESIEFIRLCFEKNENRHYVEIKKIYRE